MDDQGYTGGQILLALLGGAVAGATAALLTAPSSGAETRAQLAGVFRHRRDQVRKLPAAMRDAYHAASEAALAAVGDNGSHGTTVRPARRQKKQLR